MLRRGWPMDFYFLVPLPLLTPELSSVQLITTVLLNDCKRIADLKYYVLIPPNGGGSMSGASSNIAAALVSFVIVTSAMAALVTLAPEPPEPSNHVVTITFEILYVKADTDYDLYPCVNVHGLEKKGYVFDNTEEIGDKVNPILGWTLVFPDRPATGFLVADVALVDFDGGAKDCARGNDDLIDLTHLPGVRRLFLYIETAPCRVWGDPRDDAAGNRLPPPPPPGASGPPPHVNAWCGNTIQRTGTGSDWATIYFRFRTSEPAVVHGLTVRCLHTPIWPSSGGDITITADAVQADSLVEFTADIIEITFDDFGTPGGDDQVVTEISEETAELKATLSIMPPFQFAYKCRITKGPNTVSSRWHRVQTTTAPLTSKAVPIMVTSEYKDLLDTTVTIDFVFIPDKNIPIRSVDFEGSVERVIADTFFGLPRSGGVIDAHYIRNQTAMSFWIAAEQGDYFGGLFECGQGPGRRSPPSWDSDFVFADVGILLHKNRDSSGDPLRDCADGRERVVSWHIEEGDRTVLHETGHIPFGLADEYCCDSVYWEPKKTPNIYHTEEACREDVRGVRFYKPGLLNFDPGRVEADCYSFKINLDSALVSEPRGFSPFPPFILIDRWWWSSEPVDDLMKQDGPAQAADLRAMHRVFNDCLNSMCYRIDPDIRYFSQPGPIPTAAPGSGGGFASSPGERLSSESIVVRLDFQDRKTVTLASAVVVPQRGPANIADPPFLGIELIDDTGRPIGEMDAWHPLLQFITEYGSGAATESATFLPSGQGRFIIPFYDEVETMRVTDLFISEHLIDVDLRPAIREWCDNHLTDIFCMANFNVPPVVSEGELVQFTDTSLGPDGTMVGWVWDFGDGVTSTARNPTHVFGDDGVYRVRLRVTDRNGFEDGVMYEVTVMNVAPSVDLGAVAVDEADIALLSAHVTDPGSDDLHLDWTFDARPCDTSADFLNDPSGPDPYPSPTVNPRDVTHLVTCPYGDNGVYAVSLTVTDDDGGITSTTTNVDVANLDPLIESLTPSLTIDEGQTITLSTTTSDVGSDDLTLDWAFDARAVCDVATLYLNDPSGPDPARSPDVNPIRVSETQTCTYGDDGTFPVTLTVTDDDGGTTTVSTSVTVRNVAPTIDPDIRAFAVADVTLRVSGEKWHDVQLRVMEDGTVVDGISVTRFPGSPDDQALTLEDQDIYLVGPTTGLVVEYTPLDDVENGQPWGANPVWVTFTLEDGSEFEVEHKFNVRKPAGYLWTVDDIRDLIDVVNVPLHFRATATDPGSDDLTFRWDWDDPEADTVTEYLNDPSIGPDPFPSPDIHARDVEDYVTHPFAATGTYLVRLTVEDDDGGVAMVTVRVDI